MPPQFWIWAGLVIAVLVVVNWRIAEGELESQKSAVMAKQRAIAHTLGPKILPFRDKIEAWAQELASEWKGDYFAPGISPDELRHAPTVYLRVRLENARPERIRKAATASLHDGFTSCFFVRKNAPDPTQGPKCVSAADCDPGLLCNEYDVCTRAPEPYNMRLAYRALRVLSSAWTDELHEASSDLAVKAYDRNLDKVTREDVPIAAEILARARYFVLVLDETPPDGIPPAEDGGVETEEQRLQRVPHAARVGIWDLKSGKLIARMRAQAAGKLVPVRMETEEQLIGAQERQVHSCALAMAVREQLERHARTSGAAEDAGARPAEDGGAR